MFRKTFAKELIWFLRRLRGFLIALVVVGALGSIFIIFDNRNSKEAMGVAMGIMMNVFAVATFIIASIVFSVKSLRKSEDYACEAPFKVVLAKILAYDVLMLEIFALIFSVLLMVFPNFFAGKWQQGLEFAAYVVIMAPFPALAISLCHAVSRINRRKIFEIVEALVVIFALSLSFAMMVWEIALFDASPSTDMHGLWITMLCLLSECFLFDLGAAALLCRMSQARS